MDFAFVTNEAGENLRQEINACGVVLNSRINKTGQQAERKCLFLYVITN